MKLGLSNIVDSVFPGAGTAVGGLFGALTPNVPSNGADEMRAQEQERLARVAASTGEINSAFSKFDEPYFTNIADAYKAFQQPMFDEQAATARRELPYAFATTDGSEYIRKRAELERDIGRQSAQIGDQALDFANTQRGQVEQNRGDLVTMANAGTDAGSMAQLANTRAQALARPPAFTPIADLFQKYTALAANNAQQQNAYAPFNSPLLFRSPTGGSFGGGGSSVQVVN